MPQQPSKHFLPPAIQSKNGVTGKIPADSSLTVENGLIVGHETGSATPSGGGGRSGGGGSTTGNLTVTDSLGDSVVADTLNFPTGTVTQSIPGQADYALPVSTANPQDVVPAGGADPGSSTDLSPADHVHEIPDFDGDVEGPFDDLSVVALRGHGITASAPGTDTYLCYDADTDTYINTKLPINVICTVVANTNQPLSGSFFIDGVSSSGGSVVLCINQTNPVQNGIWRQTGDLPGDPWERIRQFDSGVAFPDGFTTYCKSGTSYGYAFMTLSGDVVVDTTAQTWVSGPGVAFGAAGTTARRGAVPKPSGTSHAASPYWLGDDGAWHAQSDMLSGSLAAIATSGSASDLSTGTVPAARMPALTGDVTTAAGAVATTLATVNSNVGSFTNANLTVNAKGLITAASNGSATTTIPFPIYSGSTAYTVGNVVQGSDNNLYRALGSTTGNSPITDAGTNWELFYLRASLTLNCGNGQRFAGSATDPAGISQAYNFIRNANVASSSVATVTIQIAGNPTGTASGGTSTTSFTTATAVPVGAVLMFTSGTVANVGKSCYVSAVSGTGPYTLTVDATHGSSGLSSTPASTDAFVYTYAYTTNTITINSQAIAANLTIRGSLSTVTPPSFWPSLTTATSGGTVANGTYYAAITITWTDASGTTRETMAGPVTSLATTGVSASTLTCAGFTLPTGATGANLYVSNALGGTLHKQSAFSLVGSVASALTITSYNAAGASPPIVNANGAAYPVTLNWGNATGFSLNNVRSMAMVGIYILGDGSTNKAGINAVSYAHLTVNSPMIISTWGDATAGGAITIGGIARLVLNIANGVSSVQTDNSHVGLYASTFSQISTGVCCCLYCAVGISTQQMANGTVQGSYVGFCTTGYQADHGSNIQSAPTNPSGGTATPTYGCGTASSPAFNTVGNQNSYIANT